ncbi:MAG TPA: TolC family outer membrane protein [Xanthobacteraceae bacterium]|jgi:outer membrane protein|nr:TolC family outer membrane protein [Xanthobacteraceae bacterium]
MNQSRPGRGTVALAIAVALCGLANQPPAIADTLPGALAQAYVNNPTINAQRAAMRATDEGVPIALSGYRPTVKGTIVAGSNDQFQTTRTPPTGAPGTPNGSPQYPGAWNIYANQAYNVTATQTLYNGFQTSNRTRQAESQVSAGRETLRLTELNLLLQAATAYMNLLRDTALLDLNKSNVVVLQEQLRQSRDRFNVGEVTKTDVAQAESRLAAGRSQLAAAESQYITSRAVYRQVIGIEPGKLAPGAPVDSKSPNSLAESIVRSRQENPNVTAAALGVDVAALQVKINEGALYPTVVASLAAQQAYSPPPTPNLLRSMQLQAFGTVTVPFYQGGAEYATIRQSKETLGQNRIQLDNQRDTVQQQTTQAWGQLDAAKAQILATQAQVLAAETALNGVREEARVGQRTTLDVLNATQELLNARTALVTAQRDRVVASFSLLAATGRLSVVTLALAVDTYDPTVHYHQVRDVWVGVRTPDGR